MFKINKFVKNIAFILGVVSLTFGLSYAVSAWQEPTAAPPAGNVDAPLNTSSTAQVKRYGLGLNFGTDGVIGGAATGLLVYQGNVGIGTASPTQKFDVNGAMRLMPLAAVPAGAVDGTMYYNSGLAKFQCFQAGAWVDCATGGGGTWALSGTDIHNTNAGNVGIGTSTPDSNAALHIFRSSGWTEQLIQGTDAAGGADTHYVNDAGTIFSVGVDGTSDGVGRFRIEQGNGAGWDGRLIINPSNGFVGIGEWVPGAQMDIANATSDTMLRLQRCIGAGGVCDGTDYYRFDVGVDGKLILRDESNNGRLTVDNSGNVGIGTVTPAVRLEVNNALRLTPVGVPPFTCNVANQGSMYYDNSNALCICNGTTFDKIGAGTCL